MRGRNFTAHGKKTPVLEAQGVAGHQESIRQGGGVVKKKGRQECSKTKNQKPIQKKHRLGKPERTRKGRKKTWKFHLQAKTKKKSVRGVLGMRGVVAGAGRVWGR